MLSNVVVIKADLRTLPFFPEAFDFISCLGVAHHLRDPEAGFAALVRLLRPGGHFLLYVYSKDSTWTMRSVGLAAAALLRRLTVRLPHGVLRALSAPLALFLYVGVVVPGSLGARLPFGHSLYCLLPPTGECRSGASGWTLSTGLALRSNIGTADRRSRRGSTAPDSHWWRVGRRPVSSSLGGRVTCEMGGDLRMSSGRRLS